MNLKKPHYIPGLILIVFIMLTRCSYKSLPSGKTAWQTAGRLIDQPVPPSAQLTFSQPYNRTVFPPDIAAPVFSWKDTHPESDSWLIVFEPESKSPVYQYVNRQQWLPEKHQWESIKTRTVKSPGTVMVIGFTNSRSPVALTKQTLTFSTSTDPVDAMILYRQVQLPFKAGEKNFRNLTWRLGSVSAYEPPRIIMKDVPVCSSCHQVSADGNLLSMEMNVNNDSGGQLVVPVSRATTITKNNFMTWSDYPKPELLPNTRGLFGRLSPSGKFIAATVNEISYAALTNEPGFCQLFFPTYGILSTYTIKSQTFKPLKGADDTGYVQTNPAWKPDESVMAFARSVTMNQYHDDIGNIRTHIENKSIAELNRQFPIQFDIVTVPFNEGNGGVPEPLKGASGNGKSNYFPRYSPDGKWIVFTRSRTGIMLQPDSELFIVPSDGGTERKMTCNRSLMNSWHSWSPNGKWLLFSSKENSIYTEIFLTHINEDGTDSPPVCLTRFSDDRFAANVPEFVNLSPGDLETIIISVD